MQGSVIEIFAINEEKPTFNACHVSELILFLNIDNVGLIPSLPLKIKYATAIATIPWDTIVARGAPQMGVLKPNRKSGSNRITLRKKAVRCIRPKSVERPWASATPEFIRYKKLKKQHPAETHM